MIVFLLGLLDCLIDCWHRNHFLVWRRLLLLSLQRGSPFNFIDEFSLFLLQSTILHR
jgi:hypothetical protein